MSTKLKHSKVNMFEFASGIKPAKEPTSNCRNHAVDIEPNATRIIASNPTTVILNDACARCRVHERRRPRVWLLRESK